MKRLRGATRNVLGLALVASLSAGCQISGSSQSASAGGSAGDGANTCVRDQSHNAATAIPLTDQATGMICPVGDVKWYSLTVPAGANLLSVTASYPGFTKVNLSLQLYASDGTTGLSSGYLVDANVGSGRSQVSSIIKVTPGHYFLTVAAVGNDVDDESDNFTLTIATDTDKDTNEPNDVAPPGSPVQATALPTGNPFTYPTGYFSYAGDVDVFHLQTTSADPILHIQLAAQANTKSAITATLEDASGQTISSATLAAPVAAGQQAAGPTSLDVRFATLGPWPSGTADYYLVLTAAQGAPNNGAGTGYTLTVGTTSDPDANDRTTRNDTPDHATAMTFGPATIIDPTTGGESFSYAGGYIATQGDHDVYSFELSPSLPHAAVVQVLVKFTPGAKPLQIANAQIDLLTPDPTSPCTTDADCDSLNQPCTGASDGTPDPGFCELSHFCLPSAKYHFCTGTGPCSMCESAGKCVFADSSSQTKVCAAAQYSNSNSFNISFDCGTIDDQTTCKSASGCAWTGTACAAAGVVATTAQPLLQPGLHYLDVHSYGDRAADPDNPYTLSVNFVDEPDTNDRPLGFSNVDYTTTAIPAYASLTTGAGLDHPELRDNFYDPYPYFNKTTNVATDVHFSQARAKPSSLATSAITGHISYEGDEDWYLVPFPCTLPGGTPLAPVPDWWPINSTCPLDWTWDATPEAGAATAASPSPSIASPSNPPSLDGFLWDPFPLTPKQQISQFIYTSFGAASFNNTGTFPTDAAQAANCNFCSAAMWDFWNNQDANIATPSPCHKVADHASMATCNADVTNNCIWMAGACHANAQSQFLQIRDSRETNWNFAYSVSLDATALGTNVCPAGCEGGKKEFASQVRPADYPATACAPGTSCMSGQSHTDEGSTSGDASTGECLGTNNPGGPCVTCCQGSGGAP